METTYKAVILDIDHTLKPESLPIPSSNITIIRLLLEKNIPVIYATARALESSKRVLGSIRGEYPIVCLNGAALYYADSDEIVECVRIQKLAAHWLVDFFEKTGISDGSLFTSENRKLMIPEWKSLGCPTDGLLRAFIRGNNVTKILSEHLTHEVSDVIVCKKNILEEGLEVIIITDTSATKENTLEIVLKQLNLSWDEVIAIGDSEADIGMIEKAGVGVAMGNAIPEVKEIADYITLSDKKCGVAHAINLFFTT